MAFFIANLTTSSNKKFSTDICTIFMQSCIFKARFLNNLKVVASNMR
jgi:hypothetical protein